MSAEAAQVNVGLPSVALANRPSERDIVTDRQSEFGPLDLQYDWSIGIAAGAALWDRDFEWLNNGTEHLSLGMIRKLMPAAKTDCVCFIVSFTAHWAYTQG